MSRPRPANSSSVSLFPFLAVLVCAMGALIFLLIVTTRRIRIQAVARAAAVRAEQDAAHATVTPKADDESESQPPEPTIAVEPEPDSEPVVVGSPPPDPDEEVKSRITALAQQRDARSKLYKSQQQSLAREREKKNRLASQIDNSTTELKRLGAKRQDSERAASAVFAVTASLKNKIEESARRIRQVRAENAEADSKYAFVPFDGKSGTNLRPILIECTNTSIRFVPEDIKLTPADLDGFTQSYNPVLAGSRALVQHWYEWNLNQQQPNDQAEPYVLLLVRPNGSLSFYIARKLLAKLGRPYGYELIEEDFPLALPKSDPDAVKVCQAAIDRALSQRNLLLTEIARGNSRQSPEQLRLRRGTGEFQFEDDPIGRGRRGANLPSGMSEGSVTEGQGGHTPAPLPRRRVPVGGGATASQRFFGSDEFSSRGIGAARPSRYPIAKNGNGLGNERPLKPVAALPTTGISSQAGDSSQAGNSSQAGKRQNSTAELSGDDPFDTNSPSHLSASPNSSGNRSTPAARNGVESGNSGTAASPRSAESSVGSSSTPSSDAANGSSSSNRTTGGPGQQIPSFAPLSLGNSRSRNSRTSSKPRRWGISSPRAGIGLERGVIVYVDADRVTIGKAVVKADIETSHDKFVTQVIRSIDQEARRWGQPPRNFYWVPMIKFRISPGGNIHYERLRRELDKVGLSITVDHTLGTPENVF